MIKLVSLLLVGLCSIELAAQHVFFGERDSSFYDRSICYDANGWMYPNVYIADSLLETADASLERVYMQNPALYRKIAQHYGCLTSEANETSCAELNDTIESRAIRMINAKRAHYATISLLIHGYRKPFKRVEGGRPSPMDYENLKQEIKLSQTDSSAFLEVYWDGMYGCCFGYDLKQNNYLFQLFVTAQQNAMQTGIALREVLRTCAFEHIQVYAHSLGAKVAINAMFNLSISAAPTPSNKHVHACLIAPAIGEDEFEYYYERTDQVQPQNYRIAVLYNERDFVLRKKDSFIGRLGPGPNKYGKTTLGCNHRGAVGDLATMFRTKYPRSPLATFNMRAVGKCHHSYCYSRHYKFHDAVQWIEKK